MYACGCLQRLEVIILPQSTGEESIVFTASHIEHTVISSHAHRASQRGLRAFRRFRQQLTKPQTPHSLLRNTQEKQQTFHRFHRSWLGDAFIWKLVNFGGQMKPPLKEEHRWRGDAAAGRSTEFVLYTPTHLHHTDYKLAESSSLLPDFPFLSSSCLSCHHSPPCGTTQQWSL